MFSILQSFSYSISIPSKLNNAPKNVTFFLTQKSMIKVFASSIIASTIVEGLTSKIMDIFCAKNLNNNIAKIYNAHTLITKSSNSTILVGTKVSSVKITTFQRRTPIQKILPSSHLVLLVSFVHLPMMIPKFLFSSSIN